MSLALIDFSSLFHRLWNINRIEVDHKCLTFVRGLNEDEVIICVDSPPYQRKKDVPTYKANRDVPDPELIGALRGTVDKLASEGFKIASCDGWEADDVIATIFTENTEDSVTVYGTDKDILQICDLKVPFTEEQKTPETTLEVPRELVVDYLSIVGDTSDNVRGISGVGPVTARKMLSKFGSLDAILAAVDETPSAFTPKTAESIMTAKQWIHESRNLIQLRTDLEISYRKDEPKTSDPDFVDVDHESTGCDVKQEKQTAIEKHEQPQYRVEIDRVDYRHSLEPVGVEQAFRFAQMAAKSCLYPKFKSAEQCMMAVMRGKAFGLDATTSLDAIEMIQGKPTLKAQLIAGIIMASPKCEFLECTFLSSETCTWETKRTGNRSIQSRTWTMKDAERMGLSGKDNWRKQPDVMLQWRCLTALARQVYPDLMLGIYAPEEFE